MGKLVRIDTLIPDAILDIRYATPNNITGRIIYADASPQLVDDAAQQLARAAEVFRKRGLRLVVWDANRPVSAQRQLLQTNRDKRYVLEDSNHCRGLAVDVTLADQSGAYLDMGTDFDNFTERAHADASSVTQIQHANRALLAGTMVAHNFTQWPYEWWHFDYTAAAKG